MSEGSRAHAKVPSRHLSCQSSTTLKLFKQSTALLQTINCRKASGKQLTGTEQGSPYCSVWNSHTSAEPTQQPNPISKARNKVWMHAKAPSCHLSSESSPTLKLFKQSTALLQTINCRKVWGKQPTGTEQGSPHCFGVKFTQLPSQEQPNPISTSKKQSMDACKGAFPLPILQKQCRP
jgi:hypothetical protein